jgi:hypothetical protein
VTSFIVLSSLVNIALGYGLAVYFGKAQLRIATRVNSRPVPMSGQGPAPVAVASSPSIDSTPTAMEPALEEPVAEPDEDSAADPVAATITPEPATEQPAVEPIANNSAEPQPAALSSPAPPEARQRANIDEPAEELTGANPSGATEPREATAEPKDVEAKAEPKDTEAKAEPKDTEAKAEPKDIEAEAEPFEDDDLEMLSQHMLAAVEKSEAEESVPASEAAAARDVEADIEAKALAGIEAFRAQLAGMQDDTPAMPTATKESSADHSDPAKNDADISEHAAVSAEQPATYYTRRHG